MKHAVIVTGGKQYRVAEGDVIYVEKLDAEAGSTVTFDKVLCVVDEANATVGTPVVAGATVTAKVEKNGKSAKVRVYKMKPTKGYRRTPEADRDPQGSGTLKKLTKTIDTIGEKCYITCAALKGPK